MREARARGPGAEGAAPRAGRTIFAPCDSDRRDWAPRQDLSLLTTQASAYRAVKQAHRGHRARPRGTPPTGVEADARAVRGRSYGALTDVDGGQAAWSEWPQG